MVLLLRPDFALFAHLLHNSPATRHRGTPGSVLEGGGGAPVDSVGACHMTLLRYDSKSFILISTNGCKAPIQNLKPSMFTGSISHHAERWPAPPHCERHTYAIPPGLPVTDASNLSFSFHFKRTKFRAPSFFSVRSGPRRQYLRYLEVKNVAFTGFCEGHVIL